MSSLRTQGPITTGFLGYAKLPLKLFSTTNNGGYGSRHKGRTTDHFDLSPLAIQRLVADGMLRLKTL